jgi:trigger factor
MQVSVEATEGLGRRMTISLPEERVQTEVKNRLQSMAPQVRISGFRPGKVPFKVVEQRYGSQVRQEVLGELMSSSFYEAVQQENLRPAGMPKIQPGIAESDSGFKFTAEFEVYPEIKVGKIDGNKIEKPVAEITDADLDNMIDKLRQQRVNWKEAAKKAAEGDRVTVNYTGTIDGEEFQGGTGKDLAVEIGSKSMIDGFEDALIGAEAGANIEVDLQFPENYGSEEVAGKPVHFALEVLKVEESELPEVDAEFAKAYGVEDGDLEKFNQDIRDNMTRELERVVDSKIKSQVMDILLNNSTFEVPNALVEDEARRYMQQMLAQMNMGQQNLEITDEMITPEVREQSKRRVSLGLILSEIIKEQGLQASPETVRSEVEKLAASYNTPDEVIRWYYSDKNRLAEVESMVLENAVVDWVIEQAKIEEVKSTFDDLVNQQTQ